MTNQPEMNPQIEENVLIYTRILPAPRELVWKVWTNPDHITHWWGPRGFSTTTKEMNLRKGGYWKFTMHGPDGRDYLNKVQYLEVVPPEKLVYQHADDGEAEPVSFHVTVTLETQGDHTKLTMRQVFASREELERLNRDYGAIEGGKQTLTRLGEYLQNL